MTAKNKPRCVAYDLQNALAAHIEASERAYECAERCLALRAVNKLTAAKRMERATKRWLAQMMLLEDAALRGKPEGGRAGK
jgi:hypothetical protein